MTDLLSLIEQHATLRQVAGTNGGEWCGPCPLPGCGGVDRFRVWPNHPDGPRWWCRQCGHSGDTIAYCVERGDITKARAWKLRRDDDGTVHQEEPQKPTPTRERIQAKEPPPAAWRKQARLFIDYCQEQLHSDAGQVALDYLHERGLTNDTISRWGLGWHSRDRWREREQWGLNGGKKVWLAQGIVIPWVVEGTIWHVKVRRFGGKPKYVRIRGGRPTLFGLDLLTGKRAVVICEGELDAVLLWQEAGDLVDVVAIGSKGARIPLPFLAHLASTTRWLVALDNDADGQANKWAEYSGRVRRVRPLQGNDLTDFYQAGGNLCQWVQYHLDKLDNETHHQAVTTASPDLTTQAAIIIAHCDNSSQWAREWAYLAQRVGWPCWGMTWQKWVADVAGPYPLTLHFPLDVKVATIEGQWCRLPDGTIEAMFDTREELAWALVASGCDTPKVLAALGGY